MARRIDMTKKDKDYIQNLWSKIFRQTDLIDKIKEWLENKISQGADVVNAKDLLNQIKKWQKEEDKIWEIESRYGE